MSSLAQDSNLEKVRLADNVKRQVAARILRYQFKPRRTQTKIPLAESQVKREWLPEIKNISFELVPDEKIQNRGTEVFLLNFNDLEVEGRTYTLSVGWGNFCNASGNLWSFIVTSNKVRLWPVNGGWGSGCSGSSQPAASKPSNP
ncbi:MAG: hypothetical protein ABL984_04680 [Pyrinomonadaceae bacterium]